ncbi:MAG TPA: IS66 family transposase [Bryobacteraceae bacterium]|nr:IS66 family transposase [Bryobacteraceae bacterium]
MSLSLPQIPSDLVGLKDFAASLQAENLALQQERGALRAENGVLKDELYAKTLHIEKLKAHLAQLKRAHFGRSSEKLAQIEQMELLIGELEESEAQLAARLEAKSVPSGRRETVQKTAAQPVRKALPMHLPREIVAHGAACACPECGSMNLTLIGTDKRELLEYVPSYFKVIVHERPKMSCRNCETITQAPMPSLPIERGLPGPGLLAHVLISKYCDHLPLYRQSQIYARDNVEIDRSTMADWVGRMSFLLEPLAERIGDYVRSGEVIHADDTPLPVQEPGRGKTKTGRLWVLLRDERPWGSKSPPAVFYRYSPDRKAERAWALLQGCRGYLHADAYSGFRELYQPMTISGDVRMLEVGCWAHARRKIYEVHAATASPAARALVHRIDELFAIERDLSGQQPEARRAVREERAVPLLKEMKAEFEAVLSRISGKSSFAVALRYALSRWPSFTRYTTDGRLDICNNAAERAMRPVALGRKNWLFAGNDDGGDRAAIIYTLIETAKINELNPAAYLRTVIERIADHPIKRIDELLPWNMAL